MGSRSAVVFFGFAVVVGIWAWQPQLTISGDNAEYILLSRSLANGDGLTVNSVTQTNYPPGFPLLLAILPTGWEKVPAFLSYVLLVGLLAYYCGWIGGLLALFEPHLVLFSSQEMPDLLFALLVIFAFLVHEKHWIIGLVCLFIATCLKSVGIVFFLTYVVVYQYWYGLILTLPMALMSYWVGSGEFLSGQFLSTNAYYADAPRTSVVDLLDRLIRHSWYYVVWGGALWLGLVSKRAWVVLAYLPIMLLWPWGAHRLLLPVIPFLIWGFCELIKREWVTKTTVAVTLVFIFGCYWNEGNKVFAARWTPAWQEYEDAAVWLKTNTSPTDKVCARKAEWMQVVSDRVTYCYPFAEPDSIANFWKNKDIEYVISDRLPFTSTARHLVPAIIAYQSGWKLVFESGETMVLRRSK